MNTQEFSKYTYKIINNLPHWFKVRNNPEATKTGQFLNLMGMSYQELEEIINYIYDQNNLINANEEELNFIYKGFIPSSIKKTDDIEISSDTEILKEITDVKDFFNFSSAKVKFPELIISNPYYIDYSTNIIYTKKSYNKKIFLSVDSKTIEIMLNEHKIWNIFDEFGHWFGLERNPNEDNYNYKTRILDIFKNEGNSSGIGLANALARELGMRINRTWDDGAKDFVIKEPMIIYNNIKVDGEIISEDEIVTNNEYDVILKGNEKYKNIKREVSYISGLEIKELNNKNDTTMYNRMHSTEETPSELKKEYAKTINSIVPLLFNSVKADVNEWNIGNVSNTGKGILETISDAPIEPFIKYGVIEKNFIDNANKNYEINTWGDIRNIGTWENVKDELKTWKDVLISEK
ncbi:MAG: hypothetical protein B6I28_05915 [Fusobacteriia bacterium 4572_132]|nr:MAG: hypothetical protein B6I28_05915 [Fusobacteriia bacterium 4572_132]